MNPKENHAPQRIPLQDPRLLEPLLERLEYGTLAFVGPDQTPRQRPLNFVWFQEAFWFHSALAGEKVTLLKAQPQASFQLTEALSFLPPKATASQDPCSATQFFLSVEARGEVRFCTSPAEKLPALEALCRKHGIPITPALQEGARSTALFSLKPQILTGKFKLGQNLNPERWAILCQYLEQSTDPRALQTLTWMQQMRQQ